MENKLTVLAVGPGGVISWATRRRNSAIMSEPSRVSCQSIKSVRADKILIISTDYGSQSRQERPHCVRLTVNYAKQRKGNTVTHTRAPAYRNTIQKYDFFHSRFVSMFSRQMSRVSVSKKFFWEPSCVSEPDAHLAVPCSTSEWLEFCGYSSIVISPHLMTVSSSVHDGSEIHSATSRY
jgi:hypothetical protein